MDLDTLLAVFSLTLAAISFAMLHLYERGGKR